MARKSNEILGCVKHKIVNGPGVESEWVGEAENTRSLFEEAQQEFEEEGDNSALHVIIFDEIDAVARRDDRQCAHVRADQPQ